jgi:hypothetical protein
MVEGGFKANCEVTVGPTAVDSVILNKNKVELDLGESVTLFATVYPDDATFQDVKWKITSEGDDNVIQVSFDKETGKLTVTRVGYGKAILTVFATDDEKKAATCEILDPPPTSPFLMLAGYASKVWTWKEELGENCFGMGDAFEDVPDWWCPAIFGETERFGATMTLSPKGMTLVKEKTDGRKETGTFTFDPAGKHPNWSKSTGKFTTDGVTILGEGKDFDGVVTYEFQVTKLTPDELILAKLKEDATFNPDEEGWGTACLWVFKAKK